MTHSIAAPQRHTPYRQVLDNGITLLVTENPVADIISARLFLKAGSRYEPTGKSGLAYLLASLLTKGTQRLSALEIAEQVESVGAHLGADAANDYFLLSLKTVSADFESIFALAVELLRSPSFPERELDLERRLTIQGIRSQREQPFSVAFEQLRQALYGDHPYGVSILGTEETLQSFVPDDFAAYHATYFRPEQLVVSISGRIQTEEAIALIKQTLGDWQPSTAALPEVHIPRASPQKHWVVTSQETQQSVIILGHLGESVLDPHYAALKLASTYLGNGLSSRLFVELREKRGLAYEVSALFPTRLSQAEFVAYMGTAAENTAIALEGLHNELARLSQIVLQDEELQTAKSKLLGQYALGKQTNSQIAQVYGWYETLGIGIGFDQGFQAAIAAVTPADLHQAAQLYLSCPCVSLVGPDAVVQAIEPM